MRGTYAVLVLTIGVSLFWGCADDETPTEPRGNRAEFVATVQFEGASTSRERFGNRRSRVPGTRFA